VGAEHVEHERAARVQDQRLLHGWTRRRRTTIASPGELVRLCKLRERAKEIPNIYDAKTLALYVSLDDFFSNMVFLDIVYSFYY
jgi:hypothetical protein